MTPLMTCMYSSLGYAERKTAMNLGSHVFIIELSDGVIGSPAGVFRILSTTSAKNFVVSSESFAVREAVVSSFRDGSTF